MRIQTRSGIMFDLEKVNVADVHIGDIAHALARICRFGGHTREFYSVAQHCVLCSENVIEALRGLDDEERAKWTQGRITLLRRWLLLHDAAEAYLGDMIRPIKEKVGDVLWNYENAIERAVVRRFGLWEEKPDLVKIVDNRMFATEKRDVLAHPDLAWIGPLEIPFESKIVPVGHAEAEKMFLDAFTANWKAETA